MVSSTTYRCDHCGKKIREGDVCRVDLWLHQYQEPSAHIYADLCHGCVKPVRKAVDPPPPKRKTP